MTDIIAWCFYPRQDESGEGITEQLSEDGISLKLIVLNRLDFKEKIDIFKDAVMLKKPDVWDSNKKLVTQIVKELKEMKEFRNLLAHSPLDVSKEDTQSTENNADSEYFKILKYKREKIEPELINKSIIQSKLRKMGFTLWKLHQLFALIRKDEKDAEVCKQYLAVFSNLSEEDHDKIILTFFKENYGIEL